MSFENKEKNFISAVLHVKDYTDNLPVFLKHINSIFAANFEAFEYIIVNNNPKLNASTIISKSVLEEIGQVVTIINLSWSHNIEDAMRSGIELAIGDFVFEFDSINVDFDPKLIMHIYQKSLEGFDAVAAVPNVKVNRNSKPFYKILNRLSHREIKLSTETFRIVSRRMLNRSSTKETFRYRKINYHYSGLKTTVIKYSPEKGIKREHDFYFGDKVSLAGNVLIYYSNIGTKISLWLCILFLFLSILVIAYTLYSFITKGEAIQPGWTTTMLFLSISFCGIFAILGVLSKYMEVLLREAQIKKPYSFKSIDRVN